VCGTLQKFTVLSCVMRLRSYGVAWPNCPISPSTMYEVSLKRGLDITA
jgi:hypothetical protein